MTGDNRRLTGSCGLATWRTQFRDRSYRQPKKGSRSLANRLYREGRRHGTVRKGIVVMRGKIANGVEMRIEADKLASAGSITTLGSGKPTPVRQNDRGHVSPSVQVRGTYCCIWP